MVSGIRDFFDKNLGTPREAIAAITDLGKAIASIDNAKLKLLNQMIDSAGKVKGSPEELMTFKEIVTVLGTVDAEKLKVFRDILQALVKLARYMPRDLNQLPIKDILEEIKKD